MMTGIDGGRIVTDSGAGPAAVPYLLRYMRRCPMNYLKVKQVAERLQVSSGTVYQLCAQGRMPHHRVGLGRGAIRISEEQFERYVADTVGGGGAEAVPTPHVSLREIKFRGPSPS